MVAELKLSRPLATSAGEILRLQLRQPQQADIDELGLEFCACEEVRDGLVVRPNLMLFMRWAERLSDVPAATLHSLTVRDARRLFEIVAELVSPAR